jgi:anti-sigma factor RsiW
MEHLDLERAHRYVKGKLPPDQAAHWSAHLESCPQCQRLVADERAMLHVLEYGDAAAESRAEPPEQATGRLLERMATLGPDPARIRTRHRIIVGATGLVAVALIVLLAWQLATPQHTLAQPTAAQDLRVPSALERRVIASLAALEHLRQDPWLIDEYEAVQRLEQLVASHEP